MTINEKEEYLKKLGYDCRGILTFPGTTRFEELADKNPRLAEIAWYPPATSAINEFIEASYDLVLKATNDKPLKIVNSSDLPSNLEAHIPATKPRRERDSLNMVNRF